MASVLRIEIDELKNAIQHLERSNRELKGLLVSDPDPEYRQAIGENIVTIAKKRARVAALEEELRRMTGEGPSEVVEPEAVPVEEPAASEQAAAAGSRPEQAQQGPGQQEEAMEVDAIETCAAAAAAAPAAPAAVAAERVGTGSPGTDSTRAARASEGVWL